MAGEQTPAYMCSKPPGYLMPDMSTEVSLTINWFFCPVYNTFYFIPKYFSSFLPVERF